jgi:hypothetical protein
MHRLKVLFTIIGAVMVLVLAGNTVAFATTGHSFILGKKNTANKITTLKRTTAGSALKLKTTSSSAAPLSVNGSGKVTNLNADKLDGLDSSQLTTTTTVLNNTDTTTNLGNLHEWTFSLAPGTYHLAYTVGLASFTSSTAFQAVCGFLNLDTFDSPTSVGWQSGNYDGVHLAGAWMSGNGTVAVTGTTAHMALFCNSGGVAVKLESETGLHIEITKINGRTAGSVATRVAPPSGRLGAR